MAQRSSRSRPAGRPSSSFTATTAATALAPLLPTPLASGRPLCSASDTPWRVPSAASSALAAALAVFRPGSRGSRPPSPCTSAMVAPWPSASDAITTSPGCSRANPSTSKPAATLETVAGAKAAIMGAP